MVIIIIITTINNTFVEGQIVSAKWLIMLLLEYPHHLLRLALACIVINTEYWIIVLVCVRSL